VLSRQVEANKLQYDSLIKRLGETSVAEKITPERIKLVQPALIPELPASPKIKAIFALAIFGGFALGFGLSFMLSAMNTSFRTVDEVEQHLALPVLGTVPKLPKEGSKLVAAGDSNSSGAEVFRTLRATVSMLGKDKDRRTYLFTSSLPGEGKTFTALNFSASLAQQGLRVLLIDMDLRRPMVENFFTDKRHALPGVTDYLLGRKKLDEVCIQHGEIAKFSWLPSGTSVPNPSELLSQVDFAQLLKDCLANYDRIIIDTAPVLPVSDTLLLADKVQTVMLVVHGYKTSRKGVERAVQLLKRASAPLSGVVLNLLPHRRLGGAYYYSYYHGYGYGHYGSKEGKKTSDKGAEKTSVKA
jgi:capsular exopolysaccharide synthesis family protein